MARFLLFQIQENVLEIWEGREESHYGYGGNYEMHPVFERKKIQSEIFLCEVNIDPTNPDNDSLLSGIDLCPARKGRDWAGWTRNTHLLDLMDEDTTYKFVDARPLSI